MRGGRREVQTGLLFFVLLRKSVVKSKNLFQSLTCTNRLSRVTPNEKGLEGLVI